MNAGESKPSDGSDMEAAEVERYRFLTPVVVKAQETDRKTNRNLRYIYASVTVLSVLVAAVLALTTSGAQPFPFSESSAWLLVSGGGLLQLRRLERAQRRRSPVEDSSCT